MLNNIKSQFNNLDSKTRSYLIKGLVTFIVIVILILTYNSRSTEVQKDTSINDKKAVKEVNLTDAEIFEDDILDEVNSKTKLLEENLKQINKKNEQLRKMMELSILESNNNEDKGGNQEFPPPPSYPQNDNYNNTSSQGLGQDMQPQWVGDIMHEEFKIEKSEVVADDSQKKRVIKLPPSFMEGFLLTGMDAMTIEGSNDNPEPVMIRVQKPAVLPNEVKANLKGCFVIAEGYGNLATHRVDAKLVSLSCVDFKGGSVIFEKIRGYVQDGDGKRGIKGHIVHRAGALIARSMIAGAFEGVGNALSGSAQTTNISALGQTTSNNTSGASLRNAALGGGVSAGAKDVRNLFLQLAKQSSPVVEIGAGKKISVVITNLVELKIQEL